MPGRLGSPSGPTTWLCRQRLDEDRMKAGKSRRIRARRARPDPEVRSSRPKSPQWSAVRRCASGYHSPRKRMPEAKRRQGAPRGAPCPSLWGQTKSSPRAWRESDCVCANGCVNESGCLTIESEPAHRNHAKCSHHVIPGRVPLDADPESIRQKVGPRPRRWIPGSLAKLLAPRNDDGCDDASRSLHPQRRPRAGGDDRREIVHNERDCMRCFRASGQSVSG